MISSSQPPPSSSIASLMGEATCKFCQILNPTSLMGPDQSIWDEHLLETENFVVTPTMGALLSRWLLVSPKRHVTSISQILPDERTELYDLVAYLLERLTPTWGSMTILEHGAIRENSLIGCGINHAHLHMIALPALCLNEIIKNKLFVCTSKSLHLPTQKMAPSSYWYAFNSTCGSYMALPETEESQFFRKLIATHLGIGNQYDYKKHGFAKNAALTSSEFKAAFLEARRVG